MWTEPSCGSSAENLANVVERYKREAVYAHDLEVGQLFVLVDRLQLSQCLYVEIPGNQVSNTLLPKDGIKSSRRQSCTRPARPHDIGR